MRGGGENGLPMAPVMDSTRTFPTVSVDKQYYVNGPPQQPTIEHSKINGENVAADYHMPKTHTQIRETH